MERRASSFLAEKGRLKLHLTKEAKNEEKKIQTKAETQKVL